MKILTCSSLSSMEEVEIAKFMGIELFAYSKAYHHLGAVYTKVNNIFDGDFDTLFIKDFGDSFKGARYDDEYQVYFNDFRFRPDFIEYVENNSDIFENVEVEEVADGQRFLIRYDEEMGVERLEYLEDLKIYTVKNGSVVKGI